MTVKELIDKLKEFPENMEMWASDEHGGPYPIGRAIKFKYQGKDIVILDWEDEN